jgi:hypothetical protein
MSRRSSMTVSSRGRHALGAIGGSGNTGGGGGGGEGGGGGGGEGGGGGSGSGGGGGGGGGGDGGGGGKGGWGGRGGDGTKTERRLAAASSVWKTSVPEKRNTPPATSAATRSRGPAALPSVDASPLSAPPPAVFVSGAGSPIRRTRAVVSFLGGVIENVSIFFGALRSTTRGYVGQIKFTTRLPADPPPPHRLHHPATRTHSEA